MTIEGNPIKLTGKLRCEKAAGGWGLKDKFTMDIEGMGTYDEDDLIGFDPGEGKVHLFSLTNTGATHDHKGDWTDKDTLYLEYNGLQDGKPYREEITIRFAGPNRFSIHEVDKVDGQITMTMDVTLRK